MRILTIITDCHALASSRCLAQLPHKLLFETRLLALFVQLTPYASLPAQTYADVRKMLNVSVGFQLLCSQMFTD